MQLGRITLAAAGLSVLAGMLAPTPSQAAWRRVSASGCSGARIGGSQETDTWRMMVNEEGFSTLDGQDMQVTCPLEDASGFQKSSISHVNVHTYDSTGAGNNYSRAYLCATSPFSFASDCGASQTASGSGFKNLSLNTGDEIGPATAGFAADYFASVKVTMFSTGGNYQTFLGYWVTQ